MDVEDTSALCTAIFGAVQATLRHINARREHLNQEELIQNDHHKLIREIISSNFTTLDRGAPVPKSADWWKNIVPVLPEDEFVKHFRVDRSTFSFLVQELKLELFTKDSFFKCATPVEVKVAIGLKCLATTSDMTTIASLFGVGKSSAHLYFIKFIEAVNKKLVRKLIKLPQTSDDFARLAEGFEQQWGFPMAIGAVDGTHIPFNPPEGLTTDFHNYKGWNSILTLAICDANGKAIWVKSGLPGRMSDSGAFKQTKLFRKLLSKRYIPNTTKAINGVEVPYLILGDSGFGMESFLMKPFVHRGIMAKEKRIFNFRHSRARRTVESMFGRVKNRWRRLLRGLDVKYMNANKVINAAFALNNLCEANSVPEIICDDERVENSMLRQRHPQPFIPNNRVQSSSNLIRDKLMEHFCSQRNPWKGPGRYN